MALTINTNISSMLAQSNLQETQNMLSKTINRLSSGLRANEAKDDAAGLAISKTVREEVLALRQGNRNANDGISGYSLSIGALNREVILWPLLMCD